MDIESFIEKMREMAIKIAEENTIEIVDYSEKSIVLFGKGCIAIKEKLKEQGGKYSTVLKKDGKKTPGWLFTPDKKEIIQKILDENDMNGKISKSNALYMMNQIYK